MPALYRARLTQPFLPPSLWQRPAAPLRAAQGRLEARLQAKDAQLAQLRGAVRELEGKLIDSYQRQADLCAGLLRCAALGCLLCSGATASACQWIHLSLRFCHPTPPHPPCPVSPRSVMRESSWRAQEAQDRRLARLEEEKARLAFGAQAAQAEADAARKEAGAQRRLVARLQAAQEGGGGGAQVVDLLQKRCRVLEAQNSRLRLAAKARQDQEEEAAATQQAAAAGRAPRRSQGSSGAMHAAADSSGEVGEGAAAENDSPNQPGLAAEGSGGGLGGPAFERWAADKRLQKKLEVLQAKLRVRRPAGVAETA